jgi:SAM-dependent methyltransferase
MCIQYGTPGKFLDVGSGLGYFVECCRRFGIPCAGLEGSAFAVTEAAKRGVTLEEFDLTAGKPFPFADNEFSVVLASQIIEHLPRLSAVHMLQECRRCLQPGGTLFLLTPSRYNRRERADPAHINLYVPSTIKTELEQCGFEFVRYLNNWPRNILTHTYVEYWGWRQVARFARPDWLSQGASCIARKPL